MTNSPVGGGERDDEPYYMLHGTAAEYIAQMDGAAPLTIGGSRRLAEAARAVCQDLKVANEKIDFLQRLVEDHQAQARAASDSRALTDEQKAWLIESRSSTGKPQWWSGARHWSSAEKAIWFVRKIDAECTLLTLRSKYGERWPDFDDASVTEHIFADALATLPPVPAQGWQEAIEAAVKACNDVEHMALTHDQRKASQACAAAIRALAEKD